MNSPHLEMIVNLISAAGFFLLVAVLILTLSLLIWLFKNWKIMQGITISKHEDGKYVIVISHSKNIERIETAGLCSSGSGEVQSVCDPLGEEG